MTAAKGEGAGGGRGSPAPLRAAADPTEPQPLPARPGLTLPGVLMEPVTSMSPARNSWYLVQAASGGCGERDTRGTPRNLRARWRW